jgi:hypothetical protein
VKTATAEEEEIWVRLGVSASLDSQGASARSSVVSPIEDGHGGERNRVAREKEEREERVEAWIREEGGGT